MQLAFAWCSFWVWISFRLKGPTYGFTRGNFSSGVDSQRGEIRRGEEKNQNNLEIGNLLSFQFLDLLRMISPVFVGPLLTFALPKLIPANADSSCDAQGQPGRSQDATYQQVRKGYLLLAIWLDCEHFIFLLVEFSRSPAFRLVAETDSEDDSAI